jgi:hypothetical protein
MPMFAHLQKSYRGSGLVMAVALVLLTACATPGDSVSEKMDPLTAVTVTYSNSPLIVYRDNPSHAAFARDLVSLGPIEVNKTGSYRYYLWLGIWSTLQSNNLDEQRDGFESIVLIVDGEPLLLDVAGWTPAAIETSHPVYAKPFASSLDAYYRVTADQIRLIAAADDLQLRTTGSAVREYELWGEQKAARNDLDAFLHRVFVR